MARATGPGHRRARLGQWWQGLVVVIGLASPALGGVGTLRAEIIPVSFDGLDIPPLAEAEQERLDTLLRVRQPQVLSTLSPDGSTVVVGVTGQIDPGDRSLHFLNIRTGELSDSLALDYEVFAPDLPMRWINNEAVRFVQQDAYGPWEIITINRQTEIVSRTQVYPTQEEAGEILGISPDFSQFVIQVFEGEEDVVYRVVLPTLRRVEVARLPEGLDLQPPAWSASGEQMALVTTSTEERRLYDRTPVSPSLATPVIQDALGRLTPEENPFPQQNGVRVFDFSQPEPLQFELKATPEDPDGFAEASLSPDGRQLLVKRYKPAQVAGRDYPTYLFPESAYYQIYDLAGNVLDTIAFDPLRGPLETGGAFIDGDRILFWGTTGIDRGLHVYDLQARQLRSLPLPSGAVDPSSLVTSEDGQTLVYGFSAVTQPPELFTLSLAGDQPPEPLTAVNEDVAAVNAVRVDPVSFTTTQGDRQGFLIQPAGNSFPPQPGPIVFWQQGGPGFSMVNEFATEVEMPLNLLPNFGLPVLVVPLSGREGFGPEFYRAQADDQNFGYLDLLEGGEIIGQIIQSGWATADQVGVTGCSYGGYYAAQITAQFPNLFGAANPQCSLLDNFTEWQLGYSSLLSYLVGQTPMENLELYRQNSPLYNATAIRTPTMMFHGADDFLQIDVARNFHDVVAASEVPITLYEFEGIGHSLSDPTYQRIAAQLQVEFFRQYLTPAAN
ncbi:MAG: prolyl oligopeptidase family serine peptidase [Nodosilinea sp.]